MLSITRPFLPFTRFVLELRRGSSVAAAVAVCLGVALACLPGLVTGSSIISQGSPPVVETVVNAFAAPFPWAMGERAYAGVNASTCARANDTSTLLPLTYSIIAQLYGTVDNSTLDPVNGCFMDATEQCSTWVASDTADCDGRAEDTLAAGAAEISANPQDDHAATTSAAALAGLVGRNTSTLRYRLSRSLRRTREVNAVLDTLNALMGSGIAEVTTSAESAALKASISERAAAIVLDHYNVVMEKYAILQEWAPWSLGAGGDATGSSVFVGPLPVECHTEAQLAVLLTEYQPGNIALDAVNVVAELGDAIALNRTLFPVFERGLLCLQQYYVWVAAALEDSRIRGVQAMLANGTLMATGAWPDSVWTNYVAINTSYIVQRSSFPFQSALIGFGMQGMYGDDIDSSRVSAIVECTQRAFIQAPYADDGLIPPSLPWCFNHAMIPAKPNAVVPGNGFAVGDAAAGPSGCAPGWAFFDGDCTGMRQCTRCPGGTVPDTTGVCSCVDSSKYVERGGGCSARGMASDPPELTSMISAGANIIVSGESDDSVPLVTFSLPVSVQLEDPSAFLTVTVTCDGGVSSFRATAVGTRTAVCTSKVLYQRRTEQTGVRRASAPGAPIEFLTYAEKLTLEVVGSAAYGGDTCSVSAHVGSALRLDSYPALLGSVRVLPRASQMTLTQVPVPATGMPLCVDAATQSDNDTDSSTDVSGEIHVGACQLQEDGPVGLFVDARRYRAVSKGAVSELLAAASVGQNRPTLSALTASPDGRVGMRVSLLDVTGAVLGDSVWTPYQNGTESVSGSWQPILVLPVGADVLSTTAAVQVDVLDTQDSTLLGPASAWVAYDHGSSLPSASDSSSLFASLSSSAAGGNQGGSSNGNNNNGESDTQGNGALSTGLLILIVIVCILLAVALITLCALIGMLCCGSARALPSASESASSARSVNSAEGTRISARKSRDDRTSVNRASPISVASLRTLLPETPLPASP